MIDRCKKSHREENLSSCFYSAFCAYTADMHHASMMSQIGRREEATDSAWRLPRQRLQCRRGCSSSPPRLVIPVFRNLFFGTKKPFLTGFLRISFFPAFSGGIFHRNVVLEGAGHRNSCFFFVFTGFFCRNSCGTGISAFTPESSGFWRVPVPAKSCRLWPVTKEGSLLSKT